MAAGDRHAGRPHALSRDFRIRTDARHHITSPGIKASATPSQNLSSYIEHSIKPSMVQSWRNYAAYYVVPYIGQRDVQDIDGAVCDALYAKLLAEGRVKAKPRRRQ